MNDKRVRRVAARILKVGESKVWISPRSASKLKEAMTKEDVRSLIKERIIKKRRDALQSRGRARILIAKKARGRRRGKGKRTGTKNARKGGKRNWMSNVRAQRRVLAEMNAKGVKFKKPMRQIYLMIKGNYFKGKKYLLAMAENEGGKK